jgi:hypothetical protein
MCGQILIHLEKKKKNTKIIKDNTHVLMSEARKRKSKKPSNNEAKRQKIDRLRRRLAPCEHPQRHFPIRVVRYAQKMHHVSSVFEDQNWPWLGKTGKPQKEIAKKRIMQVRVAAGLFHRISFQHPFLSFFLRVCVSPLQIMVEIGRNIGSCHHPNIVIRRW